MSLRTMKQSESQTTCSPVSVAKQTPAGLASLLLGKMFRSPPHLRALNNALGEVACGRCKRLLVCMPPRHGKSLLTSHAFPAWYLGTFPDREILLASYEAEFAAEWGGKARDLFAEFGKMVWGLTVAEAQRARNHWGIEGHRGAMRTAGAGGSLTGRGASILLIDDPIKNAEEAMSQTHRDHLWDWYRSVAYTRLEPQAAVIVIQTRWHHDDLGGRLLRESTDGGEPWIVLSMPAIAEEADVLGRSPGDALWPERFGLEQLAEIKASVGIWWDALYQQRPTSMEGGLFKSDWLGKRYTRSGDAFLLDRRLVPLSDMRKFLIVDLAASTKTSADFTVIGAFGALPNGHLVLLDIDRARREGPDIIPAIERMKPKWNASIVYIEAQGFQLSLVQDARRRGLPVRELRPDRDKVSRALPATALAEGGMLWLPSHAPWLAAFEAELLAFPRGTHDDQVDVLSYAAGALREMSADNISRMRVPHL